MERFANMIVAGIDVGSTRRGFHAVALQDGEYFRQLTSRNADDVAAWCKELCARAVGIDAPCCWSVDGRPRRAEMDLMAEGIYCFSTPTLERAEAHPSDYYGWMRNGARLYAAMKLHWRLFDGKATRRPVCFETFPHAIACELSGGIVPKSEKMHRRRQLLEQAGIATRLLTNVDLRDAALCALTADRLTSNRVRTYGALPDGIIVVPMGSSPQC
jgi:predicted nuclease with RNAse H fold